MRLLHWAATLMLGATVLVGIIALGAAWRLSQGPVDMSWLARRLEAAVQSDNPQWHLGIGKTALAWEGFRLGVDRPLDLRLTDVVLTGPHGQRRLAIPRAEVSLSIASLLVGRLIPRAVELDSAQLVLLRGADGTLSLDLGGSQAETDSAAGGSTPDDSTPLATLLGQLTHPALGDRNRTAGRLSQLRRVRIHDASVVVIDRQLRTTWQVPQADIDLVRRQPGGVDGTASFVLAVGDQRAAVTTSASLTADAASTQVRLRMTPINPAAVARAVPSLALLGVLDAPSRLDAALTLGPTLLPTSGRVDLQVARGALAIAGSQVPILQGTLRAFGTADLVTIDTAQVTLQGHPDAPTTTLAATGAMRHQAGRYHADMALTLDQVAFADLPKLWPPGTGGGARPWITENITAGIARNGQVQFALEADDSLRDVALTQATGSLEGDDLTVSWLRPVPPIEQGQAQLRILDPDTIDITVQSGHQRGSDRGSGLTLRSGRMRITGLAGHDQRGAIEADIAGSLPNMLALLREPRLKLLDKHPVPLKDAAGDATVALTVTLPLDAKVKIDDIAVRAVSHLTGVHLSAVAAGHDLDQGTLDLDASNDGLTFKGQGRLADIPAQLDGMMDFRAGPASQVLQRVAVSGRADARQLAAAGLDSEGVLAGELPLQATLVERRNGDGDVTLEADLTHATLSVDPIGWRKPTGVAAKASARLLLKQDRLTGIDRIVLDGKGVVLRGSAEAANGRIAVIRIDRAELGRSDMRGTVRLPANGPIIIDVAGPQLDIAAKLEAKRPKQPKPKGEPPPGPAIRLDARFTKVLLAHGEVATDLAVHLDDDGRIYRSLTAIGAIAAKAPFSATIGVDAKGTRRLTARAADAGALLRGLDLVRTMQGGSLAIAGNYNDTLATHPLNATVVVEDFRIREATALAKLLQAMTLYGMVDVLRGPGVGFSKLEAPITLTDDSLVLGDARAFSSSLGLTAKGRIDLRAETADIEGTIVPAYFFNSLLGNIPLVGKLFSPERGGGVFAARYTLRGPLDDPSVFVNPLSALTPGFLRELFGLF